MGHKINLLPEYLANQIAAGEVVQRPASVVKELLENSIDAGAKHIKLLVKDGGKNLIQVIDDGEGMDEIDARMSFERHATSKIKSTEDLFNIQTKGFRGEALASIAAVSRVEMKTRTEEMTTGTLVKIEGGKLIEQSPVQTPKGTSIAVKSLFFNVPARRKFLKSQQVEMRHIIDEFQRVALAYPEIEFTLIHNGNEIYHLYPANTFKRISDIFGKKMQERLLPVDEKTDYVKIHGYVGTPESAKLKRGEQFFFVNRRFIKSPYLHNAVMQAYEGLLPDKKIPAYFIFFEIHPKHIDVNIHPTKTEIKFDDESTVYNILRAVVRHALGKFDRMPSIDFDADPQLFHISSKNKGNVSKTPSIQVNKDFNPFQEPHSKPFSRPTGKEIEAFMDFIPDSSPSSLLNNPETPLSAPLPSIQWENTYIVTTTSSGLMLIHQHRAHTSILFNKYYEMLKDEKIPSQELVFPIEMDFLPNEIKLLEEHKDWLEKSGIRIDSNAGGNIEIKGVPVGFQDEQVKDFLHRLLAYWAEDVPLEGDLLNKFLALSLAKSAAVPSGKTLTQEEQQQIIAGIFSLEEPQYTPDGQKNYYILSSDEIKRKLS